MKKLIEYAFGKLNKEIETISTTNFRNLPGEVFEQVKLGKTFLISKNGVVFAAIQRVPCETLSIIVDPKGNISYGKES